MKLTAIFLTAVALQISAKSYTQTITLNVQNVPVEKVFAEIKRQTGYTFTYTEELLDKIKTVTVNVKNASIAETLDQCFKDQPFTYKVNGKIISIDMRFQKQGQEKIVNTLLPPPNDITGKVTNKDGIPLVAASVVVKRTGKGKQTDVNGIFTLKDLAPDDEIIISYTGYKSQALVVGNQTSFTITLEISDSKLDEIQIIAYGQTTQRFNVGSVSKVTTEEISKQPIFNPLAALQGRVPGLTVSSTSGLPGASINIQIRGQNSLSPNASSTAPPLDNPLFIIDGVPFAAQNANLNQFSSIAAPGNSVLLNNSYGGISPFSLINPADIESIEVLRDADATAIYGSRGANGVILITTKKGRVGKNKFNVNVYRGISHVTRTVEMMNTKQYLEMRREAYQNDGLVPNINPGVSSTYAPDVLIFDSTKYTDWKKYFIGGTANTMDANASFTGGTVNNQFLLGTGFHRDTYIFPGDYSNDRFSINFNFHHISNDHKLLIDFSTIYAYNKNNSSAGGSSTPNLLMAYSLPPNYPDFLDSIGNPAWFYKGISLGGVGTAANPKSYEFKKYSIATYNLLSSFQIGYNILPSLSIRCNFGYNYLNSNEYSGNPAFSQDPSRTRTASASFGTNNINSWIVEPQAEYSTTIRKHKLDFLMGSTFQQNTNTSTSIIASGYANDALIESISTASTKIVTDGYSKYKYSAIFGRLNYIYDRKYVFNLTGRKDGSSRFGPGKQFGNFGSIGGGWLFSEEKFVKNSISVISYGKLRISYGTTGNDKIGDYQFLARWATSSLAYQGSVGYISQNLYNPEFSWAINKKLQGGLELGFLKDRILLDATWYRNRCRNQLVLYPLPVQTGFTFVLENLNALVQNTGVEFQLNSTNVRTKKFTWNTSFNLTIPKNKLVSFPGIQNSSYALKYVVGKSLTTLNKFVYLGVNDTTGLFQFLTAQKIVTYNPTTSSGANFNDLQVIGNLDAKYYGGFRNTFICQGIELEFFVEFKKQYGVNYLGQIYSNIVPGQQNNLPISFLSRWQKPGDKSEIQRLTTQAGSAAGKAARSYFYQSSGAYGDASYIRFKTVALSYNLPAKVINRIKAESCRVYINAENLFTITKYKGNDPETQSVYSLPPLRTIAMGIQFTF